MVEGVVTFLLEKLLDFAKTEISKVANAEQDLARLEEKLKSIQSILRTAHVKLFTAESEDREEVREWIFRVNDVAYDALDIIDSYRVEHFTNTNNTKSKRPKVRTFLKHPFKTGKNIVLHGKMSDKIKEINERLSVLYEEKVVKGLHTMGELAGSSSDASMKLLERRQTTANITVSKMTGREEEKEAMVNWLLKEVPEKSHESNVYVASIVGMGGIGKTALTKAIYNNDDIWKWFDKRMWVCVSDKPVLKDTFQKILEEVGQGDCTTQVSALSACDSQIIERIKGKKILLVLDDVWDYEWWKELAGIWRSGACVSGSKVLITTRDKRVADGMKSDHLLELKGLDSELSWQLFIHEALREGESEQDLVGLRETAEGIVRKCRGLPLALCTVGAVVCQTDRTPNAWRDVLNSPLWRWKGPGSPDDIFSAIAISYMSLPFHLKQCLTYCCVFSKDFKIRKEDLWIADGFVGMHGGVDMEGLAERYLKELVACNLIEVGSKLKLKRYYFTAFVQNYCVLHDLVHDFALYIRGKEQATMDDLLKDGVVSDHARVFTSIGKQCSFGKLPEGKLRVLVLRHFSPPPSLATLKWLRVLDLTRTYMKELPESVRELVLLRYLNLSRTCVSELPESIIQLHDLQTLDLYDRFVERLPENLSCLPLIRHLDLQDTERLEYLPKEIGKLMGLRTLGTFVVQSLSFSPAVLF